MVMVPGAVKFGNESYENFLKLFKESVDEGLIPLERIDDAVRRILRVKSQLGLLENYTTVDLDDYPKFASNQHRKYAYDAASESITLLENGRLEMVEQNALMFDGRISYDDNYTGLVLGEDEGNRIANQLDEKSILFMASHGIIVTGPTVGDAFNDLYYLERASQLQVIAKSQGCSLRNISEQVRHNIQKQFISETPKLAKRHFSALRRILDKSEPNYRD